MNVFKYNLIVMKTHERENIHRNYTQFINIYTIFEIRQSSRKNKEKKNNKKTQIYQQSLLYYLNKNINCIYARTICLHFLFVLEKNILF